MTPDEYQIEAFKTAQYPQDEHKFEYLMLALVGECGELCNVRKKELRNQENYRERIVDESGDILWYLTALATECGRFLSEYVSWKPLYTITPTPSLFQSLILVTRKATAAADILKTLGESAFQAMTVNLCGRIYFWLALVWSHYDITLDEVMAYNLSKLSGRDKTDSIKVHERDS